MSHSSLLWAVDCIINLVSLAGKWPGMDLRARVGGRIQEEAPEDQGKHIH